MALLQQSSFPIVRVCMSASPARSCCRDQGLPESGLGKHSHPPPEQKKGTVGSLHGLLLYRNTDVSGTFLNLKLCCKHIGEMVPISKKHRSQRILLFLALNEVSKQIWDKIFPGGPRNDFDCQLPPSSCLFLQLKPWKHKPCTYH